MQRAKIFHPYNLVKVVQCLFESCGRSEVVSSCKDMTGVEAHADPLLVFDLCNNVTQIFESRADDIAAASHSFEDGRDCFRG